MVPPRCRTPRHTPCSSSVHFAAVSGPAQKAAHRPRHPCFRTPVTSPISRPLIGPPLPLPHRAAPAGGQQGRPDALCLCGSSGPPGRDGPAPRRRGSGGQGRKRRQHTAPAGRRFASRAALLVWGRAVAQLVWGTPRLGLCREELCVWGVGEDLQGEQQLGHWTCRLRSAVCAAALRSLAARSPFWHHCCPLEHRCCTRPAAHFVRCCRGRARTLCGLAAPPRRQPQHHSSRWHLAAAGSTGGRVPQRC